MRAIVLSAILVIVAGCSSEPDNRHPTQRMRIVNRSWPWYRYPADHIMIPEPEAEPETDVGMNGNPTRRVVPTYR